MDDSAENNLNKEVKFTILEFIELILWITALLLIFGLKHIYPHSDFIQNYFTGVPGTGLVIFLFVIVWIRSKKVRNKKMQSKGNQNHRS